MFYQHTKDSQHHTNYEHYRTNDNTDLSVTNQPNVFHATYFRHSHTGIKNSHKINEAAHAANDQKPTDNLE